MHQFCGIFVQNISIHECDSDFRFKTYKSFLDGMGSKKIIYSQVTVRL